VLPFLDGYITKDGDVNLKRLDVFLHELARVEVVFLDQQKRNDERNERYKKENKITGKLLVK